MTTKDSIRYTDSSGRTVTDPSAAVAAEVVETLEDGTPYRRHYLARDPNAADTPGATSPPAFADWGDGSAYDDEMTARESFKNVWDVHLLGDDGQVKFVDNREDWFKAVGIAGAPLPDQLRQVTTLMVLPSFEAAPPQLQQEVYDWVDATHAQLTAAPADAAPPTGDQTPPATS